MNGQILTPDRRIRVFLSSRLGEFASERQELARIIESEMRFRPIYFEEQARPHPPREVYSSYLAQSEIFVGIYGTGYGWIDEQAGMTISGLHDEWKLSEKLPRLVFVKDTKKPREARLLELLKEIEASASVSFSKFRTKAELLKKVAEAIATTVSERFIDPDVSSVNQIPNYTVQLKDGFAAKPIIDTVFFSSEVRPALGQKKRLLILGPPGVGKTVTLFQVAQSTESIYLSLRNRSLLSAASYLSNRLCQLGHQKARPFSSADDALQSCESLMQKVSVSLLIDDSEQSLDTAVELAKLRPGRGQLILASRSTLPMLPDDFQILQCQGFTPREATLYLQKANPTLASPVSTVIQKSGGNPLYLTYFAQSGSPVPAASIDDYHRAMWAKLSSNQKEIVAVVALCELAPTFDGLASILGDYRRRQLTGMYVREECDGIAGLISIQQKRVRLFHTAFRDFVVKRIAADGLDRVMHRSIGNALGKAGYQYLNVFHLVLGGMGASVYEQLMPTASWAEITGRMVVAKRVLTAALLLGRQKRDYQMVGFALHHVAMLKQHTRPARSALRTAILSEQMFKKSGLKEWMQIAKMTRATFLAEASGGDEAILLLEQVADHYLQAGLKSREAMARANLGFVCLRRGLMERAKKESLEALKTFRRVKDYYGIGMTLTNLQGVYTAEHNWKKLRLVAKEVLSLARKMKWPRVEAAALNGFTIFYRRTEEYGEAEKACRKAIEISVELGLADLELLQTTNLGNIFKDQKRYDEARQCFEKVVAQGEQHGFRRSIASGKELLADLLEETGDVSTGVKVGDVALRIYRELGDVYRVATTLDSQAGRYDKLRKPLKAGAAYQRAAEAWWQTRIIKECVGSYISALESFLDANDDKSAAVCLGRAWRRFANEDHHEVALGLINKICTFAKGPRLLLACPGVMDSIPSLILDQTHPGLTTDTTACLAKVFKTLIFPTSDTAHLSFLRQLLEQYRKKEVKNLIFAIAIGIEQAPGTLFKLREYQQLCESIAESVAGLNYRRDSLIIERWIVHLPAERVPVIEYQLASDEPSTRAVAAVCALISWLQRETFVSHIGKRIWCELGLSVNFFSEGECRRRNMPGIRALSDEFPVVFTQSNVPRGQPQPPCMGIVRDDFLSLADRVQHPENKHSIWALMLLYNTIIAHFTHFGVPTNTVNKLRGEFVCDVFGVRISKRSASNKKKSKR